MSLLWWILAGFLLYWILLLGIRRSGWLPESVNTQGPIITIHTRRGRDFLDRLSRWSRFWRAWGNLGVGIAVVIMFGMFLAVVNAGIAALFAPEPTGITEPQNVLVIPGINEFLPLSAAPEIIVGLLVGLVVHEGGHGLLCRVEDIEIESMGVALLAFIPIGAFVQPEERSQLRADRGGKTRMFAAGVMNNFVITLIAFLLLFAIVGGAIVAAPGAAIGGALSGSAAAEAGIGSGDRITAIDGQPIENGTALEDYLATNNTSSVSVTLGDDKTTTVNRSIIVVAAVPDGPSGLDRGDRILAVNSEPVHTVPDLRTIAAEETVIRVNTGQTAHTFPAGAYAPLVEADGPIAAAGAPVDETIKPVLTRIDGERVLTRGDAQDVLATTEPGEEIEVEAHLVGESGLITPQDEPEVYNVTLGTHPEGHGQLGVQLQQGMTGIDVDDFGIRLYPSERFLASLGGDTDQPSIFGLDTFFGMIFTAMVLPIASIIDPALQQNFAGFTGVVTNFFEVTGPLDAVAPLVFLSANVLFWVGWINFNLGIFNCIPAFPLDGGHLLRASTEAVISRLPIENRYVAVKYVTVTVGLTMLAGVLLMLFGQGLLT